MSLIADWSLIKRTRMITASAAVISKSRVMELLCLIRREDRLTMQVGFTNSAAMGLYLEDFEVGMTFFVMNTVKFGGNY